MTIETTTAEDVAALLERLKQRPPRVHCIVNGVAENFTANVLIALGAVPSMTANPEEVADFARGADALAINLGTLDAGRRAAIEIVAGQGDMPWVLDPTFVDRSPLRRDFALKLVAAGPTILRGNPAELAALQQGRESDPQEASRSWGTTIAVTEAVDRVFTDARAETVANGHSLMSRITASGCALGAVMAAFAALEPDPHRAAVAALASYGVAGEIAGRAAKGPGSFQMAFLDALYVLTPDAVASGARIGAGGKHGTAADTSGRR